MREELTIRLPAPVCPARTIRTDFRNRSIPLQNGTAHPTYVPLIAQALFCTVSAGGGEPPKPIAAV